MAKAESKKRPKPAAATGRVRQLTKKQQKAQAKKETRQRQPLIGSFRLTWQVFKIFGAYWKPLGGIVLVYLILNVIFASGISNINSNFSSIKADINGNSSPWHAVAGFLGLVASAGASSSGTGSALQSVLFVFESLVIIWALRHLLSGQAITVKMAYYRSMTPLVPFLLVILANLIRLLPITIGGVALAAVTTSVFTDSDLGTAVSAAIFALLAAWSIYMVSASIFALYIVTLPDMQPRQALRSAKDLVRFRRWAVLRKTLYLPIFMLIVMAAIIVPLILFASVAVPYVFYILSMLAILFAHSYLYNLYRSLLE